MSVKCPKCNHEMNDFEVKRLWCTNCNEKFSNPNDLIGIDELKADKMLGDMSEAHISVSGTTDNVLSEKIEYSGKRVKIIFCVLAIVVLIGALVTFFVLSFDENVTMIFGAAFLRILSIEEVGLAFGLFAIGELIYYRTLGLARLIQQNHNIQKLLEK